MSGQHEQAGAWMTESKRLVGVVAAVIAVSVLIGVLAFRYVTPGTRVPSEAELEKTAKLIQPLAQVKLAEKGAGGAGAAKTGEQVYQGACAACHGAGVAGAPKIGDKAAWAPRLGQGLEGLTKSAIAGKGAMPPKGGNPALTDAEIARAIVHMANQSGASFKDPAVAETPAPASPAAAAAAPAPAAAAAQSPAAAPAPQSQAAPAAPPVAALPAKIFFEKRKSDLSADAVKTIQAVAETLARTPGAGVDLTGYTDKSGSARRNQELAKERAVAVRQALLDAGVDKNRIHMKPPQALTGSGEDPQARRVEIALTEAAAPAALAPAPSAAAAPAAPLPPAAAKAVPKPDASRPPSAASYEAGKAVYAKTCIACHSTGAGGAPKLGDKAAWAPRLVGGVEALARSAVAGKGAMPPKGANLALTDADIRAAVDFMIAEIR